MTFKYVMSGAENALAGALAALSSAPRGERILFVLPAGAQLDMAALRVIRREAATRGVGVALVTEHPGTRMAAAREGVSTFRDAARAESARWRRLTFPRSPRRSSPSGAEVIAPLPPGLFQKASPSGFRPLSFVRSFARRRSPWWGSLLLVVALCLLMGGLLFALSIVVPDAAITMTPGAEPIEATVRLRAVSGAVADLDEGVVPAQTVSTQVSGEARTQTTGRRSEPATKAGGRVVFINMTSRQITIPQGTIVSTATGNNVQYLTVGPVDLAPGGRASAAVQALLPGPNGNARAGTVTRVEGPLSLSIAVSNEAGFAGGTTAPQPVVTEEDKTRLQAELLEELKNQALEKLLERDAKGSFISPDSISVLPLSPAFTPFVGEVSDELFLSMSVQAVGLAVDQAEANAAALAALQAAMPPATRLISDTVRFSLGPVAAAEDGSISFSVTAAGTLLRSADTGAVRRLVSGMTPEAASTVLQEQFALADAPGIRLGPDWLPYVVPSNLPSLPWRIRVMIDWDAAAQLAMRSAG